MLELPEADLSCIYELAESAYLDSLTQNSPRSVAYACQILSEVALRREDFETSLAYALKGLAELPPEVPGPKASLLVQVAKVQSRLGNYNVAMGDLARVYVEVGFTDRGVYAYEKAIQMSGLLREEQETKVS